MGFIGNVLCQLNTWEKAHVVMHKRCKGYCWTSSTNILSSSTVLFFSDLITINIPIVHSIWCGAHVYLSFRLCSQFLSCYFVWSMCFLFKRNASHILTYLCSYDIFFLLCNHFYPCRKNHFSQKQFVRIDRSNNYVRTYFINCRKKLE